MLGEGMNENAAARRAYHSSRAIGMVGTTSHLSDQEYAAAWDKARLAPPYPDLGIDVLHEILNLIVRDRGENWFADALKAAGVDQEAGWTEAEMRAFVVRSLSADAGDSGDGAHFRYPVSHP